MDVQNYMKLCKNSPSLRRYRPPSRPHNLLNAVPPTPGQQLATPPNFSEVYWDRTQHKHPQRVISDFSFLPDLTFTKEEVDEALHHRKAF